jgi:hypothetical protein
VVQGVGLDGGGGQMLMLGGINRCRIGGGGSPLQGYKKFIKIYLLLVSFLYFVLIII